MITYGSYIINIDINYLYLEGDPSEDPRGRRQERPARPPGGRPRVLPLSADPLMSASLRGSFKIGF